MTTSTAETPLSGPVPIAAAAAVCAILALGIPPVPDHAYQFHLAGRVLDGATLYVDVAAADMHPPLFTWLAMAIEAAGRLFGTSGLTLYPAFTALAAAGALLAVWRILPGPALFVAALLIALLPLSGPYFGQGEHLALIFALPYLCAAAVARERTRPQRFAIAAAAAFGLAMKPHFALIWLLTELYLARRNGPRSLLRLESVTIGTLFVLYVVITALAYPQFFAMIPWLMELYPDFARRSLVYVLFDWRTLLFLAGLVAGRLVRDGSEWRRLADLLSLASAATFIAMLLQTKGWGYHWYPVNATAFLLIALAARSRLGPSVRVAVPAAAVAAVALMSLQPGRTARALARAPTYLGEMMAAVERHGDGGPVVALSQYIQAGFPLVSLTGSTWTSPYAHLWMVHAFGAGRHNAGPEGVRAYAARWADLEREIVDRTWQSIEAVGDGLVIVEYDGRSGIDFRHYLRGDPRFRAWLDSAVPLDTVGVYIIFRGSGT